jgi:hypothetical protein
MNSLSLSSLYSDISLLRWRSKKKIKKNFSFELLNCSFFCSFISFAFFLSTSLMMISHATLYMKREWRKRWCSNRTKLNQNSILLCWIISHFSLTSLPIKHWMWKWKKNFIWEFNLIRGTMTKWREYSFRNFQNFILHQLFFDSLSFSFLLS